MSEDDAKAALVAKRIAELEAEMRRNAAMIANLQSLPDSPGYQYAAERIEAIAAEIKELKTPAEEPEPEKDGPPLHSVLMLIGVIVGIYGLSQYVWSAVIIGIVMVCGGVAMKNRDTETG
ncbi:hypothetical protein [Streptomyces hydrogenans]|uniref:hypothetical protein n=1 Tax=Streptomyces hydrogenans TaxID=1873719 RepID=UPI003410EE88